MILESEMHGLGRAEDMNVETGHGYESPLGNNVIIVRCALVDVKNSF